VVKRQTVWLSTMMVLSLMLIGYYTMNNGTGVPTSSNTGSTSVTTTADQPSTGTTTTSSSQGKSSQTTQNGKSGSTSGSQTDKNTSSTSSSAGTTPTSATDWYVNTQTQLEQQMAQKMDSLSQVISNNNASASDISKAEEELRQLETLSGELSNAHDMIVAKGYQDAVIIPSSNKAVVYVKATTLSASQAVQIMNIVSGQLNIPINSVSVHEKA
jgi:stage III sporulation protein AH